MKNIQSALALALLSIQASVLSVQAQVFSFDGVNKPIPDNLVSGVSDIRSVATANTTIGSISVSLNISGDPAFNGDLYVYLQHGTDLAVLLNRSGRTVGNSLGYSDNGYNVTFNDTAVNGDIHNYRFTLFGNQTTPVDVNYQNALTGTWAPDGRNVSPLTVLDSSTRDATLSAFNSSNPNGEWTLFLSDLSAGGTSTLNSWGLAITSVPEPAATTAIFGALCLATTLALRFRRS
jgi:subtilisin-like proprotein convertase family protein